MSNVYHREEDFILTYEHEQGFVFLHLEVLKWTNEVRKRVRIVLDKLLLEFEKRGHDVVFGTTQDIQSVRLWEMVKPCFELKELNTPLEKGWIGAWLTGKG